MKGDRSSFPIRDTKREQASSGSSAVKTYKMSPEELEDFRAKNAYVAPTNSNGAVEKKGMHLRTLPNAVKDSEQPGRDTVGHIVKVGPDKDFVLTRIAAGKSISAIERELGMRMNGLHYYIRKWEWVGITPGKARAILNGEPIEGVIGLEQTKEMDDKLAGAVMKIEELENQLLALDSQNAELIATSGKTIEELQTELSRVIGLDGERLTLIAQLVSARDQFEQERDQALQAVSELEEERMLLLQTIENATLSHVAGEEVNHPDHYTAGGIEVIDFIVAKLTADEFAGYCKGNIMKYVARANLKGGLKDLRKLRWYVDRLLEEVDANES